jgi:hypothetical protein
VTKAVIDLVPGDVLELEEVAVEVVTSPFLGHRGISPFDQAEIFVRAEVRELGGDAAGYLTWPLGERVELRQSDSRSM